LNNEGIKTPKYNYNVDEHFFDKKEREIFLVLLSGYVEQIKRNSKLNERKATAFRWNLILLATIVLALLSLIPVSVQGI